MVWFEGYLATVLKCLAGSWSMNWKLNCKIKVLGKSRSSFIASKLNILSNLNVLSLWRLFFLLSKGSRTNYKSVLIQSIVSSFKLEVMCHCELYMTFIVSFVCLFFISNAYIHVYYKLVLRIYASPLQVPMYLLPNIISTTELTLNWYHRVSTIQIHCKLMREVWNTVSFSLHPLIV